MEEIIRERELERERALKKAAEFAECVAKVFKGKLKVVVYGSYARGDFNAWSDIDVLVLTSDELPKSPIERLTKIERCLAMHPEIEPIILTFNEYKKLVKKRNPIAEDVEKYGIVVYER